MDKVKIRLTHEGDPAMYGYHLDLSDWHPSNYVGRLLSAVRYLQFHKEKFGQGMTVWVYFASNITRKEENRRFRILAQNFLVEYPKMRERVKFFFTYRKPGRDVR
jgi:hypothetical protein